jgi:hypothetical protein
MSSYAEVASHNAPPPSQQPVPDPALLEGSNNRSEGITNLPDVDSNKVNEVSSSQDLDHIKTESSEKIREAQEWSKKEAAELKAKAKEAEKKGKAAAKKAEKK